MHESIHIRGPSPSLALAEVTHYATARPAPSVVARMSAIFRDVRENLFQMTPAEYAETINIPLKNITTSLERADATRPITVESFQKILTAWDQVALKESSKLDGLRSAKVQLLNCIQEFYGGDAHALLYRWAYEHGIPAFKSASILDLRGIQNAKNFRVEYDFSKLYEIAVKLSGEKPASAKAALDFAKKSGVYQCYLDECARAKRPRLLAELHAYVVCCGSTMYSKQGHQIVGVALPQEINSQLCRYRFVALDKIEAVFDQLHESGLLSTQALKEFKRKWDQQYKDQIPTCNIRLGKLAKERGLSTPFLAECLGLKESERNGQSHILNRYFNGLSTPEVLPFGVVAFLVAESKTEAEQLISDARSEFALQLKKTKCTKSAITVYVERLIWGISAGDIADVPKKTLDKIEKLSIYPPGLSHKQLISKIYNAGLAKLMQPLRRWISRTGASSVSDFYRTVITQDGAKASYKRLRSEQGSVAAFISGHDVPTLDKFKTHHELASRPIKSEAIFDWYNAYAKNLITFNYNDLARSVSALTATKTESLRSRCLRQGTNFEKISAMLIQINNCGWLKPDEIQDFLNALEITSENPQRNFFEALNRDGNIISAIRECLPGLEQDIEFKKQRDSFLKVSLQLENSDISCLVTNKFSSDRHSSIEFEQALAFAERFPGATRSEIQAALDGRSSQLSDYLKNLHGSGRTAPGAVVYIAESMRAGMAQVGNSAYETVLKQGRLTTLISPHLMCILAASKAQEIAEIEQECRLQIMQHLKLIGIDSNLEDLTELVFFGLDPSRDLNLARKEFIRALADRNDSHLTAEIKRSAHIRTQRYAEHISSFLLPKNVINLMQVWRASRMENAVAVLLRAGINLQLDAEYLDGRKIPMKPRLMRILKSTSLSWHPNYQLAWQFDYAEWIQARNIPLLARMLYTEAASGDYEASATSSCLHKPETLKIRSIDLERAVMHEMAITRGVASIPQSKNYLSQLEKAEVPDLSRLRLLLSYFGRSEQSERFKFLKSLVDCNGDFVKAARVCTDIGVLTHFKAWNEIILAFSANNPEIARITMTEPMSFLESKNFTLSPAARELGMLLYGCTRNDFLNIYLNLFPAEHLEKLEAFSDKLDFLASVDTENFDHDRIKICFKQHGYQAFMTARHLGVDGLLATRNFQDPAAITIWIANKLADGIHFTAKSFAQVSTELRSRLGRALKPSDIEHFFQRTGK